MQKQITIVGLGKMGSNLARQLVEKGWEVHGYNRTESVTKDLEKEGIKGLFSLEDIVSLEAPRVVWIMLPHLAKASRGKPAYSPVDEVLNKLVKVLEKGDIIVDGGNSFFEETKKRARKVNDHGINFLDVGVSGGPGGARSGACMMVGGTRAIFEQVEEIFKDTCVQDGYNYFGKSGAGHFVKMVHNGIEYGMMQAIAEGFEIMKKSDYKLKMKDVAEVYNHGSVIESSLIGWMESGFREFGDDLREVLGSAGSGGAAGMKNSEGQWTVDVAKKQKISAVVIEDSVKARIESQEKPNFQGKIINTLRNQFGGHDLK